MKRFAIVLVLFGCSNGGGGGYGGPPFGMGNGIVPDAPTGLVATAGDGEVTLNWAAPANPGQSALTGYNLYRGDIGGSLSLLTTLSVAQAGDPSYVDGTAANGTAYDYQVAALNAEGQSPMSGSASATPTAGGANPNNALGMPCQTPADCAPYMPPTVTCQNQGMTCCILVVDDAYVQSDFADTPCSADSDCCEAYDGYSACRNQRCCVTTGRSCDNSDECCNGNCTMVNNQGFCN